MLAGLGAPAALAVAERQGAALRDRFAARADNAAEAARLRAVAGRIPDVEALLKDRRALTLVLEAFQLESEIDKRAMLRRVLTEDPAEPGSLVNRLTDPRWRALADAFTARRALALTPAEIARQTPAELRAMELNRVAGLDPAQVAALDARQVAALDPGQLAAIAPDALKTFTLAEVAAITTEGVAALGPAQLRALSPAQVAAIEPRDLAALGTAQLRALAAPQLAALTGAQIRALRPEAVAALSAAQARAFSATQLEAFGAAGRAALARAPFLLAEEPAPAARAPLADPRLIDRLVEGAMTNRFEKAMGDSNPGLREALYFRRMAGGVTSIAGLMSDRALLEVARGALGLPKSFGLLPFEQQRDMLTRRVDLSQFQDPKAVARMAQRYVATLEAAAPANPVLALFGGGGVEGLAPLLGRRLSLSA